jgi:tRNA(Ile)-lysidine synthase
MMSLSRRFQRYLEQCAIIPRGSRGLVAVSGGADSTALLLLLHQAAPAFGLELHAAHLDHALRPDSFEDAAQVRELCARLGVPLTAARIDVAALAKKWRGGLEEVAREARRTFLRDTAQALECGWIALAHQRDDQAETFLLRLLRGAGTTGLAGMRACDPPFVRPLLGFSRAELVAWLTDEEVAWRDDPSNREPVFVRNRVRHQLLPLLEEYNPAIRQRLAELCRQLADDEADWVARTAVVLGRVVERCSGELRLPCAALREASPALAGRLVRAALKEVRGSLRRIDAGHVAAVLALACGARPQGELHLPGAWVGRRYTELIVRREPPPPVAVTPFAIPGPGRYLLPAGRALVVSVTAVPAGESHCAVEFCAARVPFPLQVRAPRPGDRLRPSGLDGSRKLQDLFVDFKLPVEQRAGAALVFGVGELLWIAGVRRGAGFEPAGEGGAVLRLELAEPAQEPP